MEEASILQVGRGEPAQASLHPRFVSAFYHLMSVKGCWMGGVVLSLPEKSHRYSGTSRSLFVSFLIGHWFMLSLPQTSKTEALYYGEVESWMFDLACVVRF
jgi:hypothetical protein